MDPNRATTEPAYERLAYEAALRALDKQERLIDELRSRPGLLLAAASLAASFLGREAFAGHPKRGLAILALVAFLLAVGASVYVLLPKTGKFIFAMVGAGLYEGLYELRDDLGEVYRRLAYDLDRFSRYFATAATPERELAQASAAPATHAWSRSAGNARRRFRRTQVISAICPNTARGACAG